ncbi:MAG: OmpH family outer membrane protein [Flavobacteriales bacterium]
MKKFLTAVALVIAAMPAMAQGKLGHIDMKSLMLALPERPGAEAKMQEVAKGLDTRIKAMGAEYEARVAELQAKPDMTQTEKDMARQELSDMEQRITAAQEKAQEDLSKLQDELLKPMVDRANGAVKAVAEEGNYTYIFDSSVGIVLYFDKGDDVINKVKAKLGIQ